MEGLRSFKIFCLLLILTILVSFVLPVLAGPVDSEGDLLYSYFAKPEGKPGKPSKHSARASVALRNIFSGDVLMGDVLVIAEVSGDFDKVECSIDDSLAEMVPAVGDRYQTVINVGGSGLKTLMVEVSKGGNIVASDSAEVTVVSDFLYSLVFEIDYIAGHAPSEAVLDYVESYWASRAIYVEYDTSNSEEIPYEPYGDIIESSEFWAIEAIYNDGDDKASDGTADYFLEEKWVLYGTRDANSQVGGYTYIATGFKDLLAGNYIFIADGTIGAAKDEVEAVVLCHEAGHSIGIAVIRGFSEKYDSDVYSVMSYITWENSIGMADYWYYSKEYWATANLDYYKISV